MLVFVGMLLIWMKGLWARNLQSVAGLRAAKLHEYVVDINSYSINTHLFFGLQTQVSFEMFKH
jgi:hypothetical protein